MNLRPDQADRPDTQVRAAAAGDLKFIDHLQSRFSHQVGYLPLVALEKKIKQGQVWVSLERGQPAGYVLGASGYKRRDDVAIIYQSAIDYSAQRRLLGTLLVECWAASLPSAVNQICLWCAQDIDANLFWRSLGFQAIAWRAGSISKGRVHIYWSRLTPETPADFDLWIPEGTSGGLLQSSRDVHLFEPGQDWDARPAVDWGKLSAEVQAEKLNAERVRAARPARPGRGPRAGKPAITEKQLAAAMKVFAPVAQPGTVTILVGGKWRVVQSRR